MANDDFIPPVPQGLPVRRESSRSPIPFIALGCGGVVFLAILVGGVIVGLLYVGNKAVDPAINAYLQQIEAGKFAEAYDGFHPAFKDALTEEQFVRFAQGISGRLGPYKSKSLRGINVNSANGVTTTVATYSMTFGNGTATRTFTLIGDRIARVDFTSPLLQSALKCPHCEANLGEFANFCPNCGKPLQQSAEAEATL